MKKLFAVIGNPISHSMSPSMHNDLFAFYGLDACYHGLRVEEHFLEDAVKGLRAIGISGFNVTVPHKITIMPFLDSIDPLARAIGAVNTVVNENGQLVGYNTDGNGFVKGLVSLVPMISNKKVLIIGAGGAARALYFSMAHKGVQAIDLANRTVDKAKHLRNECPFTVSTNVFSLQEAEAHLAQYDLIIQTTSIGMSPEIENEPLSLQNISENTIVSDIIYNPLETKFLQTARKKGATIQNGLDMFVHQGALAFEKWTGIQPDIERMKQKVMQQLGGIRC